LADSSRVDLFNTIAGAMNTVYDLSKAAKNPEEKQQLNKVYDTLVELKHKATLLEDENRKLRDQVRFKSDQFEFRNPFWYEKGKPGQPFCPKCYAGNVAGPMNQSVPFNEISYRICLVCGHSVDELKNNRGFF
jgi:hypothetical protein